MTGIIEINLSGRIRRLVFGAGAFFLCLITAFGQEAISSRPNETETTSQSTEEATGQGAIFHEQPSIIEEEAREVLSETPRSNAVNTGASGVSSTPRRLTYSIALELRGVYDDNINLTGSARSSDYYLSIEPKLSAAFGGKEDNHLRLEYYPQILVYSDHSENDTFQQTVHFDGQYRVERLTLRFSQDIQVLDSTDISYRTNLEDVNSHVNLDVSGRVRLNIFATNLAADYDLSSKTFVSAGLSDTVNSYSSNGFLDYQSIGGNVFLNYRYSDKLIVGLGGTGGFEIVDPPSPSQTYEEGNVRLVYEVRGKFQLNASGGLQFRQFEGNTRGTYVTPVLELGASYKPFDGTQLKLTGRRLVQSSASLVGQDFSSTSFDLAAQQRLFSRIYLGLASGYENAKYFNALAQTNASRDDNYYYFAPSADFTITRFWSAGIYYLWRQNDTSASGFGFTDKQIGVRTSLRF